MNNFTIEYEGNTYWISRSMAVACFVFTEIEGDWYVLANKRGKGTPDFQGYWNVPCGYLDFNETLEHAAKREVYEETGVKLNRAHFYKFNDAVTENRQNVTFIFYSIVNNSLISTINKVTTARGGELDEVEEVSWIPVDRIEDFRWAFDHDQIINELVSELVLE